MEPTGPRVRHYLVRLALAAGILALLSACGSVTDYATPAGGTASPSAAASPGGGVSGTPTVATIPPTPVEPSPSPTLTQAPPGTLVLTQSSAGGTYRVHAGQVIEVTLPGDGQPYHGYTTPRSSDTAVVRQAAAGCVAPSGQNCTRFDAAAAGEARLSSTWDAACRQATPPCEVASRVWQVLIQVS